MNPALQARGEAHRAMLRHVVLPYMRVGSPVPHWRVLSKLLGGISQQTSNQHMRQVLMEDGYQTVVRCIGGYRSAYISAITATEPLR